MNATCLEVNVDDAPCTSGAGHRGTHTRNPTLDDVLNLERMNWPLGRRELFIRENYNLSLARYTQLAIAFIDSDQALEADPALVYSLRAARASRETARAAHSFTPTTSREDR